MVNFNKGGLPVLSCWFTNGQPVHPSCLVSRHSFRNSLVRDLEGQVLCLGVLSHEVDHEHERGREGETVLLLSVETQSRSLVASCPDGTSTSAGSEQGDVMQPRSSIGVGFLAIRASGEVSSPYFLGFLFNTYYRMVASIAVTRHVPAHGPLASFVVCIILALVTM
jgi:hypothetical protein